LRPTASLASSNPSRQLQTSIRAAVAIPFVVFLAVYAPAVGLGFISDDFGWIEHSRVTSFHDIVRFLSVAPGFYRPLVSLSFAANYALFGTHALGYGWTNLALAVLDAVLLSRLARAAAVGQAGAAAAAAVWLLNFHGIGMALLWISGRTALILVACALVAITGVIRGSILAAVLGFAAALLSKEEAVVLPLIAAAAISLGIGHRYSRRELAALGAAALALLAGYVLLRTSAGAMTPWTAPSYYRFTFAPAALARNALEYADRTATFAAAVALVGFVIMWPRTVHVNRRLLLFALAWCVAALVPTIAIPSRSSLYACFPSIGAALACGHLLERCWESCRRRRPVWALAAMATIPVMCLPVYLARTQRWTELAVFSSNVLEDLAPHVRTWPDRTTLVLVDDRSVRTNLDSAFGSLITDAVSLRMKRDVNVWVEPPMTYGIAAGMSPPCDGCRVVRLTVRAGRLRDR